MLGSGVLAALHFNVIFSRGVLVARARQPLDFLYRKFEFVLHVPHPSTRSPMVGFLCFLEAICPPLMRISCTNDLLV